MKEQILKLRKEGKSYKEIVEILGCSKSTISFHCSKLKNNKSIKSANVEIKNKRQIKDISWLLPDENTISKIVSLRKEKKKYKEISDLLEIKESVIYKVCRKMGLVNIKNYNIKDVDIEKILKVYSELKSTRKTGIILGISRDLVRKYVNIEIKSKLTEDELKKNKVKSVIDWRRRVKLKLVNYKGGKCENCGYNTCIDALEFHHKNPNEKDFTISGKSWSFEKLKKESDKCILVCSNCHKEIHYENKTGM